VDVLVLNAAHESERAPFLTGGMDALRPIMELNFFVPARLCLALLPGMRERGWGRVVAVGSLAASVGEAHGPSYCASKAALAGLFRNLAIDYSRDGITFNTVEPGPIATERLSRWGPQKARRLAMASATRAIATPEDVAHAVRFLASPHAGHITGEELRVDGGLHLGNPPMYVREPEKQP
jgi:3-oxoacyl-[acyl-carrier protein] reductase